MSLRAIRKILAVSALSIGALALFAPTQLREYACRDCGAYRPQIRVLYVPVYWRTGKPRLWHYWLRHVDAQHRHRMVELERTEGLGLFVMTRHITYSAWSYWRWDIDERTLIAILTALPDASQRRRFVDTIWLVDSFGANRAQRDRYWKAREAVRAAYDHNPHRKDWPTILHRLGLWE